MFDPHDLPEQQAPVGLDHQIKCVMRELSYRRTVYPRLVERGKMTGSAAAKQICHMEAVLETLKGLAEKPKASPS